MYKFHQFDHVLLTRPDCCSLKNDKLKGPTRNIRRRLLRPPISGHTMRVTAATRLWSRVRAAERTKVKNSIGLDARGQKRPSQQAKPIMQYELCSRSSVALMRRLHHLLISAGKPLPLSNFYHHSQETIFPAAHFIYTTTPSYPPSKIYLSPPQKENYHHILSARWHP